MWIISPTLILVPYLFKQKETKWKQTRALLFEHRGA
jgi:hypothetical protein